MEKKTMQEVKQLLGWKPNGKKLAPLATANNLQQLPSSFDSATNWPQCTTIGTIYDQARCGSCWAFGAVESISDRFCIASKASFNQVLSFEDMVSCDDDDSGCEGGDAGSAFNFAQQNGLVTGTCYPYVVPTCAPSQEPCLNFVDTPSCQQSCSDSETWTNSLHYLSNAYSVNSDVNSIQSEMYQNGPVEACFDVYEDFLSYKSGVYQHTSGEYLGGHCVKCIGYGTENGTPYWLCNNSWTTYWGDNGQFKIVSGQDECGIEDDVVAGTPQV